MYRIKNIRTGLFIIGALVSCISCKKEDLLPQPYQTPYPNKAYIIQLSTNPAPVLPSNFDDISRYHFYGITWDGKVEDNLLFARQMGYSYVMYQYGMENSVLANNLFFIFEGPEALVDYTLNIERWLHLDKTYTAAQISTYMNYYTLKDTTSGFPENMATGWWSGNSFSVEPDWQQQKVIDYFVTKVMAYAHLKEKPANKFLFGGLAWDGFNLEDGVFCLGGNKYVGISYWTGKDSAAQLRGTTHDYKTYSKGRAAYFISIKQAQKAEFPDRFLCCIVEPYGPYGFIKDIEKQDFSIQKGMLIDCYMSQECGVGSYPGMSGTEFVDDTRLFLSGLLTKDRTGSSTPDNHTLSANLAIAQKAAMNGAWFNWYGRFSGTGDNAPIKNIYEVPNWLQLIRVVANWDNLNGVPLSARNLNLQTYTSTNSQMDNNIIYSRQPKTQKLFAVFLNSTGEIKLNPGESIVSIKRVNKIFCETIDGTNDLVIEGNTIRLKNQL